MDVHTVFRHVERHIRHVQEIVREVFLDYVALVTKADHEIVDPIVGIRFHDVPDDRLAADLDHRLGAKM
ncbi:hypothetical protein D3C78_1852500 [compost metagenome]